MSSYPTPVNQFARLIHVSGAEPTGTYALGSRWNNIRNGKNWDGSNCTAAIGAVSIDASTGGRTTSNPARIRNAQLDWSGGIGLDDVNYAIRALYGPQYMLELPGSANWADVLQALRERRFVAIQGDYDQVPYAYQAQKGGTFDHAFGLGGYRASDGRVLYYDPLDRHAVWVPQSVIRPAAEKLALVQRGSKARLFVGFTRPMPPPYIAGVTYRYGGEPRRRGRWVARRDDIPIRSRPDVKAPVVTTIDHREDFAVRQATRNGWLGTADGTRWVWDQVMWFSGGGITGQETVR